MFTRRRAVIAAAVATGWRGASAAAMPAIAFPRDHGAHPETRTEWWYATGWLGSAQAPTHGVQVTYFRSRTGYGAGQASRFAPRQLLFAHAALTDLGARSHRHDQRIARWSGDPAAVLASAALDRGDVPIGRWSLVDEGAGWHARIAAADFALDLQLRRSQPPLLQGDAGISRKGPDARQISHYYSEVQLELSAGEAGGRGRAWLDHEWSDEFLAPDARGWDWAGINLFDGSALTVFVLRRADGSALWAGGSWRRAGAAVRAFGPDELRLTPLRRWRSPRSGARYPVQWRVQTPAGEFELRTLLDDQELDSRASTGTIYWEGLSELVGADGRRVGLGYLELTGYAGRLRV
ncbi:MAG: carotenoid 1,2-hydratase [Burkholderiales bacterium]|nr:carotenoid 1,2-hydratase [Burkholderiales bacterium]